MEKSTIIYIACSVTFLTLLILVMTKGKIVAEKVNVFFSDILKEEVDGSVKFSQGRFYLFLSLIFYFFILGMMSIKAVKPETQIKTETFEQVISALQWTIALFAGYVFGAKGLKVLDSIFKYKGKSSDYSKDTSNTNPQ